VAAGVAVLAVGAVLGVRLVSDGSGSGTTADIAAAQDTADVPVVQSGTAYSAADFGTQAVALQSATPTPTPMTAAALPESSGENGYRVQATVILTTQLADCLKGIDPTNRPRLVDAATYDGDPALVIVYNGANTWDVYAVGTNCTAADAHLLRFVRVPR
jgi:hypothetical protein